ncbi:hypothetical protein JR316_0008038 [Psilocybe cubensis]|uniref:Uncharacterized protein n=2 Tax=Psilocybe cubensis TaxID=181762 RepID=A0ACB8GVE5_PSICU|nr:hypothetical protein JR316_0008038 [Psilocybe cubensis]KAH9479444.1 hypothetical protein JR316_0008038 [Psilocybe cubensis]
MSVVTPSRRLSARRGSTTAPDPFGLHATVNLNPNRSSSSKLTIVRVPAPAPPNTPTPLALNEPPASPVLGPRRLHRRPAPQAGAPERVSFAFSSFGPPQRPDSPDHSPSSSPRLRPSSPHLAATTFGSKPRLTPDQLVDLARSSTAPRPQLTPNHQPPSPGHTLPATFTPLPDDIYLPFIDRPSEVSQLISSPPDVKLFSLLAQIFRNKHPVPLNTPDHSLHETPVDLPRDPAAWTYNHLIYHLTRIDRDIAPDFLWAIAARKCILAHSELLWERIKGALGIPPELDVDYDFLEDDQESPDTSDISDDEGKAARGHWSDWDAVMDSPIHTRKRLSMSDSPVASIHSGRHAGIDEQDAHFRSQIDDRLQGLQGGFTQRSASAVIQTEDGETTIAPTPHGVRSPPEQEGLVIGAFSPPLVSDDAIDHLSIEPLLAPQTPSPSVLFHPLTAAAPPSHAGGEHLGGIAEGAEEEEEQESATDITAPTEPPAAPAEESDPDLISPSQIQGLRISTSPLPPSHSFSPPILSPISPLPPYPPPNSSGVGVAPLGTPPNTTGQPSSGSHSRASSFSSVGPFQRSESTGNLSASWSAMAAAAAAANANNHSGSVFGSEAGDSSGYMSDSDRLPGQGLGPLFPSNFARLAGGPTLRANTASGRSAHVVPHARYPHSIPANGGSNSSGTTFGGPSLANRPGKVRTYSHGASSRVHGGMHAHSLSGHQQQVGGSSSSSSSAASVGSADRRSWGGLSGSGAKTQD